MNWCWLGSFGPQSFFGLVSNYQSGVHRAFDGVFSLSARTKGGKRLGL